MKKEELMAWREKVRKDVSSLMDAPEEITADKEIMLDFFNINPKSFNYADVSLKSSKEFMSEIIKVDGILLRFAYPGFLKDLDLVIPAVENNGALFKYLPLEVKVDKKVICAAIASPRGDFLSEAANKIKDNRELMLFSVRCRGTNLRFASDRLKDDKEVVVAAISQNWLALGLASNRLKGNFEIMTFAITKNPESLKFANKSAFSDREWAHLNFLSNGQSLEKFPQFADDPELVKIALEKSEKAYIYMGEKLRKDINFLVKAIDNNYKIFFYVDDDVAKSEKIILATWMSICAAYVKENATFLNSIQNERILKYWEEYKKTENPPSFSRFPEYYVRRLQREKREKEKLEQQG